MTSVRLEYTLAAGRTGALHRCPISVRRSCPPPAVQLGWLVLTVLTSSLSPGSAAFLKLRREWIRPLEVAAVLTAALIVLLFAAGEPMLGR